MPFDAERRRLEREAARDPARAARLRATARRGPLAPELQALLEQVPAREGLQAWLEELVPFGAWVVLEVVAAALESVLELCPDWAPLDAVAFARQQARGDPQPLALDPEELARLAEGLEGDAAIVVSAAERLVRLARYDPLASPKPLLQQATLALGNVLLLTDRDALAQAIQEGLNQG